MDHEPQQARRRASARLLLVVSVVCAVAALVAATVALTASSPRPVEQIRAEVAVAPPSTIAPVTTPSPSAPPVERPPASERRQAVAPTTTVPERSPLAELLGPRGSAIPAPVTELPLPVAIRIDSIGVDGDPVVPVGIDPKGQVEVPKASEVGWYRYGARPGEPGATVLAAHVSWVKEAGVFALLSRIAVGDAVEVTLADGSVRTYEVVERAQYAKTELPPERVWTSTGPETLVLITCGGQFNPQIHRYRDNIVAYAVPVAASAPPAGAA